MRMKNLIKFLCGILTFIFLLNTNLLFAQDKIVAIVNNEAITQKDMGEFVNFMKAQYFQDKNELEAEKHIESIKGDLLDKLIDDRLILQEAKNENITIDDMRVKSRIDDIRRRYGSSRDLDSDLMRRGLTLADVEKRIREQMLMRAIIERKVKDKIVIRPSEVTSFYENNPEDFNMPAQKEFKALVISGKELANKIYGEAKDGKSFEDLSKEYSIRINKFLWVKEGELKPEVETAISRLNKGGLSRPVKIAESYYIFLFYDLFPPKKISLEDSRDSIYSYLFEKKMAEKIEEWISDLKKKSYIKIF
ncbi:MAG: hypothetical protein C4533_03705 [Candidatus Omnitrophota bacterium]|jgi:parvulin-like peptidyl-prolyl isomerase|nr:MAG: hypothetical protein C4533_03705 [Candidatus Omnitrophota bacterium]